MHRKRAWMAACAGSALWVGGCGVPDAPGARALQDVPGAEREGFAAGSKAPHAIAGPVDDGWLDGFDEATASVAREAAARNWDIRAAEERLTQARLLASRAGSALWPEVDGVAGVAWGDAGPGAGPETSVRVGVAASWELDVWGRLRAARRGAEADALAVEADLRGLRQAVAAQAAGSWALLATAREQSRVIEELLAVRRRTLEVAAARQKAGVAQPIDVGVAQADVTDAQSQLEEAGRAIDDAARAVELLLGRYPAAAVEGADQIPRIEGSVPVGLPSELLERRPDIVAADRRVAAAFFRREEARAARLPRLALTGELGMASDDLGGAVDPDNAVWNLGANLIAPLVDGGRRRIDVELATSAQREALAGYVSAALSAFGEVEAALSGEATLARQQGLIEREVEDLTRARDAAELRYRRGLLTIFELTQVEERLFGARRQLVAVRGARVGQRIALHLALGGGFDAGPGAASPRSGGGETP